MVGAMIRASTSFAAPERVLVRPVSARYAECLRSDARARVDVARARVQHEAYVAAIRALGIPVEAVPADDTSPDACFIEDTAVVTQAHAIATRPGAPSRRAEVAPVAAALARHLVLHSMEAPASLDGGDVLRIGHRLYVGLSSRTNRAGADALANVAARDGLEVVVVTVRGGLHLKSACTLATPTLLVYDPAVLRDADLQAFRDVEAMPAMEPVGANVLALGDATLASAAAPATVDALRARGIDVRVVDVGEMHKGDGALTCLSLRVPRVGCWST
jgi:dimethylargininase